MRYFLSLCTLLLLCTVPAHGEFRNQFAVLDDGGLGDLLGQTAGRDKFMAIAKQFGYEWVIGEPYATAKANAALDAGLKVMYNSNNNKAAKWVRFNNPTAGRDQYDFAEPTLMSIGGPFFSVTSQQALDIFHELETALCMTTAGKTMAYNDLYTPGGGYNGFKYRIYQFENKNAMVFTPNFRSNQGIAANVAGELREKATHQNLLGGKKIYSGLYYDEVRQPDGDVQCQNPINTGNLNADYDTGRKKFTKDFRDALKAEVEADGLTWGGMSGNPYDMSKMQVYGQPGQDFTLLYNESSGGINCDTLAELNGNFPNGCGTQNTTTYGNVPKNAVQVSLTPSLHPTFEYHEENYNGAAIIMGRAAGDIHAGSGDSEWGGWFANKLNPGETLTSIYLVRAIPNWDNMVDASVRNWNEPADNYTSSNTYSDQQITYSRHRDYANNHKLFVTRHSGTPSLVLNSNEKLVSAKCTDFYFLETTQNCATAAYFSQSGNTVTLGANIANDAGYVLTVHRHPAFLYAEVKANDQLDVCYTTDDATAMLPAPGTASTGWTVTVAGIAKTPTSTDRLSTSANCFRLVFTANTITSGTQTVIVSNTTGGNITAGTNIMNTSTKIPSAGFSNQTATNYLAGGGGPGLPVTTQTKYQWQQNLGPLEVAPLYGVLNGQLVPSPGGQARLIIKIRDTVNAHVPTGFPLYFAVDPADPTDMSTATLMTDSCATNPVCYTPAQAVANPVPSTELLPSDETTNVACGLVADLNNVPLVNLSTNSETECVYPIKFKDTLTAGQRVYFYPKKGDGTQLTNYNILIPRAVVADPRSDFQGGLVIGGTR